MKMRFRVSCALAAAAAAAVSCSSGGGSATGGADGGGGSNAGSSAEPGMEVFSCALGDLCNQITGTPSSASAEQQNCTTLLQGAFGSGCSMTGVVGYCDMGAGGTQYVYTASEAQIVQSICNGTWVSIDGGAVDGGATVPFAGTWLRAGSQTITCEGGSPSTTTFGGDLIVTIGSSPDTIVGTQPDGCATNYNVAGNVATAPAGQMCSVTTDAGMQIDTVTMHTLTLSADGSTLTSMSTTTIDETATMTMCSAVASGTYTRQ